MDDIFITQIRDCFTAGYTMPQFCVDNGIKKPLFVLLDGQHIDFLWNIYVQFKYDKSAMITPQFASLSGKIPDVDFSSNSVVPVLQVEQLSEFDLNDFDKVITLFSNRFQQKIENILYLNELTGLFVTRTYAEIPLLNFMQNHPKVKLIVTNFPKQPKIDDEDFDKIFFTIKELRENFPPDKAFSLFEKLGYNKEEALKLISAPVIKRNLDASTDMQDDLDPIIGVKNNQRMTAYQPKHYKNKIYFVGTCHQYGINAPFDKTIPSYLQKFLNEKNLPYRVENESQRYFSRQQDLFYNLVKLKPKPDDIIFVYASNFLPSQLSFFDLSHAFDDYDYRDLWVTRGHVNEIGYKILAEKFFQLLVSNNFFKDLDFNYPHPPPPVHRYGIPKENSISPTNFLQNKELEEYKAKLREKRFQVGAIVMNCNPFTLGHEYLVEYAAKKVKKLYIFVVEEDRSEFKFADRFELVKRGVKKFSNVEVLPSGKFIISQQTFSGYFNKENLQDVAVDSSEDVEIFAREIAPSLGITVRFVGEEPEDSVTRQYNENMRNILPQYNIDFCEIPRREIGGEVISAKKVREALKVGDFDTIKKLVPKTTLKFLRENFS